MRTGGEERRFWIARAPRFPATTAKCLREPFSKALGAPGSRAREDGRLKCRFRATLERLSSLAYLYPPVCTALVPPPSHLSTVFAPLHRFLVFHRFLLPLPPPLPSHAPTSLSLSLSFNFGFAQTSPLHLSRYIPFAWVGTYPWRKCT